jgi:3-deoxy-D-manno-octulosonic-acid transferase
MLPGIYRAVTTALVPPVRAYLLWRCRQGKEDRARLGERLGFPSANRTSEPLVWVHAASVGEAVSVLGLIARLREDRPALQLLMTTGTVAAARLMRERLPTGVLHQFVPVDAPRAVERFLDHWRPDLALWVESELWPNLVLATQRRGVPMVLVNGRLSAGSEARWRLIPGLIHPVLSAFALCLAQDQVQAERFRRLGAPRVASVGDLKAAAAPLGANPETLSLLRRYIDGRPVWLAASTHGGEEELVAAAHARIAATQPRLLTIIAPRHPTRGVGIATMLASQGLRVSRRSAGEPIDGNTEVYLADTMGELGVFFRLAGIAFIGGSLVAKGGHNPFEAARLDCAILHGPDMRNCAGMAGALDQAGGALTVENAESLAAAVSRLLADPHERATRAKAAARAAAESAGALDAVLDQLAPWLDPLAPNTASEFEPIRLRRVGGSADARA